MRLVVASNIVPAVVPVGNERIAATEQRVRGMAERETFPHGVRVTPIVIVVNGSSDIIRIDAKPFFATERVGNGHHFNDATVGKFFLRSKAVNPQKLLEVFVKRHPFVGIFVAVETLILNGIIGVFRHLVLYLAFAAVSRNGKRLGGCLVFAVAVMAEGIVVLTPPTIEIVGFLGDAARFIAKPCLKQRVMRFPTIRYGCSAQ